MSMCSPQDRAPIYPWRESLLERICQLESYLSERVSPGANLRDNLSWSESQRFSLTDSLRQIPSERISHRQSLLRQSLRENPSETISPGRIFQRESPWRICQRESFRENPHRSHYPHFICVSPANQFNTSNN